MEFNTKKVTITQFDKKDKGETIKVSLTYRKPFTVTPEDRKNMTKLAGDVAAANPVEHPCIITFGTAKDSYSVLRV